jgi:hypothetical protein
MLAAKPLTPNENPAQAGNATLLNIHDSTMKQARGKHRAGVDLTQFFRSARANRSPQQRFL